MHFLYEWSTHATLDRVIIYNVATQWGHATSIWKKSTNCFIASISWLLNRVRASSDNWIKLITRCMLGMWIPLATTGTNHYEKIIWCMAAGKNDTVAASNRSSVEVCPKYTGPEVLIMQLLKMQRNNLLFSAWTHWRWNYLKQTIDKYMNAPSR